MATNPTTGADVIGAINAPTNALAGLSVDQLLQAIGMNVPNLQESAASSTLGLEQNLGLSDLAQQQNWLQQGGNQLAATTAAGQQGLEQQQYANTMTQYPEQQAEAAQQYGTAQQGLQGSLAATGTLNTQGSKLQQGNLAQQYGWQQEDIARSGANAALGQSSEELGSTQNLADIAQQQQNLQLAAQANGISTQQMLTQWQQGLQQMGVNANPSQAYLQYLSAQGSQISGLGSTAGQEGLLTPGQLTAGGLNGGVNLGSLFAGQPEATTGGQPMATAPASPYTTTTPNYAGLP